MNVWSNFANLTFNQIYTPFFLERREYAIAQHITQNSKTSAPWTETKEVTVHPSEVATVDFKPPFEMASGRVQQGQRFSGAAVRMDGTTVEAPTEMANSRDQGQFSGVAVRMDGTRVEPPPVEPAAAGPSAKGKRITNGLRFGGAASVPAAGKGGKKADAGEKDRGAVWNCNHRSRVFVHVG